MTMTEERSMEDHAREHRSALESMVELYDKLRRGEPDDLEWDDWETLDSEFDSDPDCEACGHPHSVHTPPDASVADLLAMFVHEDDTADEDDTICDEFTLTTLEGEEERARERIEERSYGFSVSIVVDVTLYGGGPAGGVEFDCEKGKYGLELNSARVWHQDWFQPKGYAPLDNDTAQTLFELWGIEYAMGEN